MREGHINLYSDTQTRPSLEMRQVMLSAPIGDEQKGLDESVNQLCATVAELLGMEAAVFLPSGTMCNEIAMLVHCRPGDEIYAAQGVPSSKLRSRWTSSACGSYHQSNRGRSWDFLEGTLVTVSS